jgi:hypothetical protein
MIPRDESQVARQQLAKMIIANIVSPLAGLLIVIKKSGLACLCANLRLAMVFHAI